jgi:hypothetical protein
LRKLRTKRLAAEKGVLILLREQPAISMRMFCHNTPEPQPPI